MFERDKEIANLYDGDDGLSLKMIAEYLGCCIETVRNSLRRQRIQLRPRGLNRRYAPQNKFPVCPLSTGAIASRREYGFANSTTKSPR